MDSNINCDGEKNHLFDVFQKIKMIRPTGCMPPPVNLQFIFMSFQTHICSEDFEGNLIKRY